jgi:hypothetical protein
MSDAPTIRLPRPFASRDGAPVIERVEARIFTERYFGACMECTFCDDACCAHGVDVEEPRVQAILARADVLEPIVGVSRERWFTATPLPDADFPGGAFRRTTVRDGRCVFRAQDARGCILHAHSLAIGEDYHVVKPLVSTLFPLSFNGDLLCLSDDLVDQAERIICGGGGMIVYDALRGELEYYFGGEMVAALDALRPADAVTPAEAPRATLPVLG